jgi:hypothetical protein
MDWKMHKVSYALLALPLLLLGSIAQAQTAGTITFTANKTSSTSSFAPVLTWSTSPVATSCAASGGWSGTKFASGSETEPTISANTSYSLTCTWGSGAATISWTAPTKNTDGSSLTNLTGYKILYGTSSTALNQSMMVNDPKATSATVPALATGTWYFSVRAVNSSGAESADSNQTSKTISSASAAKTVAITVTPPPTTTTLKVVATPAYDVLIRNSVRVLGRQVGTVPIGTTCGSYYQVGTNYFKVQTASVNLSMQPRSNSIVAKCAKS